MNGVMGFTSLLLDTKLDHEQKNYIETIRKSGKTLLNLIDDILDFSKIEAGKIELEYQPFFVHTCIEEAIGLTTKRASIGKTFQSATIPIISNYCLGYCFGSFGGDDCLQSGTGAHLCRDAYAGLLLLLYFCNKG